MTPESDLLSAAIPKVAKHRQPVHLLANPTSPAAWRVQRQHFLDFGRLLRHLTVCFYLSDVKPGQRAWEVRPPVPEPQERVSEKAPRINLRLLQLSRHTPLYLFNPTNPWTINNFNRAHGLARTHARLTPLHIELSKSPVPMNVCMGLSSSLGKLWSFPSGKGSESVITQRHNEVR